MSKVRQILLIISLTLLRVAAPQAQEVNYWNTFYSGNISGAIAQTNSALTEDSNEQSRIYAAIAQFEFCSFAFDQSECMLPAFTYLTDVVSQLKPEDPNYRWLQTELQNALIANSMHYEKMRDGFRQTRFEHINYFKLGDGFLTNYLSPVCFSNSRREEANSHTLEVYGLHICSTIDQKQR